MKPKIFPAIALLAACTAPAPQTGAANPASEFCVKQGGKSEIRRNADGSEYGVCRLPDGRTVEEWAYFRQHHQ